MIRRTVYRIRGAAISLAFVSDISGHPEMSADAPPPPPPPTEPKAERAPYLTKKRIHAALSLDPAYSERLRDRIGFEAVSSRIAREGF